MLWRQNVRSLMMHAQTLCRIGGYLMSFCIGLGNIAVDISHGLHMMCVEQGFSDDDSLVPPPNEGLCAIWACPSSWEPTLVSAFSSNSILPRATSAFSP